MSIDDRWELETIYGLSDSQIDHITHQRDLEAWRNATDGPRPDLGHHGIAINYAPEDLTPELRKALSDIPEKHRRAVVCEIVGQLSPHVGVSGLWGPYGLPLALHAPALALLRQRAAQFQPSQGTVGQAVASLLHKVLPITGLATASQDDRDKADRKRDLAALDDWEREAILQSQEAQPASPDPLPRYDAAENVRSAMLRVGATTLPLSLGTADLAKYIGDETGQKAWKVQTWLDNNCRARGRHSAPLAGLSALVPWPPDAPKDKVRRWWIGADDYSALA